MSVNTSVTRGLCQLCCVLRTTQLSRGVLRSKVNFARPFSVSLPKCAQTDGKDIDERELISSVKRLNKKQRESLQQELRKYQTESEGSDEEKPPTSQQLRRVLISSLMPFIGFGFLDNFLMITVGDWIEMSFGTKFGITVLAAAGLGNLVSDVAGIGLHHYVESLCNKFGFQAPHLTQKQFGMWQTRYASTMGKTVGITIGCLLGMCPLLFIDKDKSSESGEDNPSDLKSDEKKEQKEKA